MNYNSNTTDAATTQMHTLVMDALISDLMVLNKAYLMNDQCPILSQCAFGIHSNIITSYRL